jgi:hypothetical protein
VNIPQLETEFAELLGFALLVLGGIRLVLHEWKQIAAAWRRLRRPARKVIPGHSP